MKKIFNFKSISAIAMLLMSSLSFAEGATEKIDRPVYEELGVSPTILFIVMLSITIILIMALVSMAKSTSNAFKYKHEKAKKAGLLVFIGLLSSTSFAAESSGGVEYAMNFSDNAFWAFLILDVILVMMILYFAGITKGALTEFKADKEPKSVFSSWNKKLTNAVEIEDEDTILLDHDYDGIKELDNDLPPWWKYGFYITIVWAAIYYPYYHIFNPDKLQEGEFELAMANGEKEVAAYKAAHPNLVTEETVELLTDASSVNNGKTLFTKNCVACHAANAGGGIGPNLTDENWIYGGDIKGVFHTVSEGANNGMPAWKESMNPTEIQEVSSFILSLKPVDGGKEAEGDNVFKKS